MCTRFLSPWTGSCPTKMQRSCGSILLRYSIHSLYAIVCFRFFPFFCVASRLLFRYRLLPGTWRYSTKFENIPGWISPQPWQGGEGIGLGIGGFLGEGPGGRPWEGRQGFGPGQDKGPTGAGAGFWPAKTRTRTLRQAPSTLQSPAPLPAPAPFPEVRYPHPHPYGSPFCADEKTS